MWKTGTNTAPQLCETLTLAHVDVPVLQVGAEGLSLDLGFQNLDSGVSCSFPVLL